MAKTTKSFRRPPKDRRVKAYVPVTEEQRVLITKTPEMVNNGFHPERSLIRKGWVIDEKTRSPDGQTFEMVISAKQFNLNREKNNNRARALAGSKPALDHDSVESVDIKRERISGATMRRELEQTPAPENTA